MKRMLFNLLCCQPMNGSKFHGGGEYAKTVFQYLVTHYNEACKIVVFYNFNEYIDEWIIELIQQYNIEHYDVKDLRCLKRFNLGEYDTYYCALTGNEKELILPDHVFKIATIHGLRNVEMPVDEMCIRYGNLYSRIKALSKFLLKKKLIKRAERILRETYNYYDHVIFVSNHTRIGFNIINPTFNWDKIDMFYSPLKFTIQTKNPEINLVKQYGNYILMLGGNRWLKNPYRGIIALKELLDSGLINCNIVIVGKVEKRFARKYMDNDSRIFNLDYASANVLESLYCFCKLFFYPTLNEGFGYPPLEAMHYGTTCIVSSVCSLPEIYGDAVYYTNPYDIREIKNRIIMGLEEPIMKEKVLERYQYVTNKQKEDLKELCNLLVNENVF